MRILQIIPSFETGGAEKVVLDYLTYMPDHEIMAVSLYGNNDSVYNQTIEELGLNVIYLDKKGGLDLSMSKKILDIVKSFKPDVVHSHLNVVKYLFKTYRKYNKKIKFFHTIHNEPQKDASGLDYQLNRIAFKKYNVTPIVLTKDFVEKAVDYYGVKEVKVLGNGINLDKFKVNTFSDSLRLLNKFVIGHIGRFFHQKNHSFIIDVFKEISKKRDDAVLVLVGDGELKLEIENKVERLNLKDKVVFLGIRKDIPEIVQQFDVFLFPSFHEGFPITLIEVQAAGIKSVISDKIDHEVVLSDQTFQVSLNDSVDKWVETILNSDLVNSNYQQIDQFDIKVVLEKLLIIYGALQ